ncbi:glutamate--cysteine ligase regulatory subunit-like [Ornithodoros turicata]|uniref:glutamate--cysteine ligase regulatory subunit-like n=1 Tax=Ornithodoros turicata TaxID=34597 RepID=UPI003139D325
MASEQPAAILERVNEVIVDTGNILGCKELTKKVFQSLVEELIQSLTLALMKWSSNSKGQHLFRGGELLEYTNKDLPSVVHPDERSTLKITVKIFLCSFDVEAFQHATSKVMEHLGVTELDSVIMGFPWKGSKVTLEQMQPLWEAAEKEILQGRTLSVGVSDLDSSQLKELHQWAAVKPSINQVNLDSCCVIPQDMAEFAKANNIQLLTHSDPKVVLDSESMKRILSPYLPEDKSIDWTPRWVARYSVLVKRRGFIKSKGYIADLVKPTK